MKIISPANIFKPQPLRSLISDTVIDPASWVEELIKNERPFEEIIVVIKYYEFVIACIIKAFSFLEIEQSCLDRANSIYRENSWEFFQRFFEKANEYESFIKILNFINHPPENWRYGLCETIQDTEKLYMTLNKYIDFCFMPDRKSNIVKLSDLLIENNKQKENKNLVELSKKITWPNLNTLAISELLRILACKKRKLQLSIDAKVVEVDKETEQKKNTRIY